MSAFTFPMTLPGVDINITRETLWAVKTFTSETGMEVRTTQQPAARYRYVVTIRTRDETTVSEVQMVNSLIDAVLGEWDNMSFTDPLDGDSTRKVRIHGVPQSKRLLPDVGTSGHRGWWEWKINLVTVLSEAA